MKSLKTLSALKKFIVVGTASVLCSTMLALPSASATPGSDFTTAYSATTGTLLTESLWMGIVNNVASLMDKADAIFTSGNKLKVPASTETCDGSIAGAVRYEGDTLEVCNSTNTWTSLAPQPDPDGVTQARAGLSCKSIFDNGYSTGDHSYFIDPNGGDTSDAFQAYCDMTNDGGGWTRVAGISSAAGSAHLVSSAVGTLTSDSSIGKFSDTIINQLKTTMYKMTCGATTTYYDGSCTFDATTTHPLSGACSNGSSTYGGGYTITGTSDQLYGVGVFGATINAGYGGSGGGGCVEVTVAWNKDGELWVK